MNFIVWGNIWTSSRPIWGTENPREYLENEKNSPKINVWCAMLYDKIIGPYFFQEKTVNQESYLKLLTEFAFPKLSRVPNLIFQQDGAPPHWGLQMRRALDRHFPDRWIGRGGPIAWPARSPDITPLDFFMWGFVKDNVFKTPVKDLSELTQRISDAIKLINKTMLKNSWRELRGRLEFLQENESQH